jgi:hypothetical protein
MFWDKLAFGRTAGTYEVKCCGRERLEVGGLQFSISG